MISKNTTLIGRIVNFPILLALLGVTIWGCSKSTEPSSTQGQISMTSKYSTLSAPPASAYPHQAGGVATVDSIRVSRARFLLRGIKFKTVTDSADFKSVPFVLELNLGGTVQDIAVANVPLGTYKRIEFEVHRLDSAEFAAIPDSEKAQFQDFMAGDRYSIIIEGTVYRTPESDTGFVFRSRIDAKQKIDLLPELVISEASTTANATMLISSADWFRSGNILLDPTDSSNENTISDNLKNSIRVFKDNNRDGSKDP